MIRLLDILDAANQLDDLSDYIVLTDGLPVGTSFVLVREKDFIANGGKI